MKLIGTLLKEKVDGNGGADTSSASENDDLLFHFQVPECVENSTSRMLGKYTP
jgi:hypothetical protein